MVNPVYFFKKSCLKGQYLDAGFFSHRRASVQLQLVILDAAAAWLFHLGSLPFMLTGYKGRIGSIQSSEELLWGMAIAPWQSSRSHADRPSFNQWHSKLTACVWEGPLPKDTHIKSRWQYITEPMIQLHIRQPSKYTSKKSNCTKINLKSNSAPGQIILTDLSLFRLWSMEQIPFPTCWN